MFTRLINVVDGFSMAAFYTNILASWNRLINEAHCFLCRLWSDLNTNCCEKESCNFYNNSVEACKTLVCMHRASTSTHLGIGNQLDDQCELYFILYFIILSFALS